MNTYKADRNTNRSIALLQVCRLRASQREAGTSRFPFDGMLHIQAANGLLEESRQIIKTLNVSNIMSVAVKVGGCLCQQQHEDVM